MPPFQKKNRNEPNVIDGVRSTEDLPARTGTSVADGREPDPVLVAGRSKTSSKFDPDRGLWRFRSRATNHMVLLWAEPDEFQPGGRIKRGKIVQAKFKDGYYETTAAANAEALYANKNCGIGQDFWDADQEDALARAAQYNNFKRSVQADPELFARFRKDYDAGDFDDVLTAPAQPVAAGAEAE